MVVLALTLLFGQVAAGDNLLANPGFEQVDGRTNMPQAWTVTKGAGVSVITQGPHAGRRAIRLDDTKADDQISFQSDAVPVTAGAAYMLSGWVRTSAQTAPTFYIQFHAADGTRLTEQHAPIAGPTEGWVLLQAQGTAPAGAVTATALIYSAIRDTGAFDADDLTLVEVGAEAAPRGVDAPKRLHMFVDSADVASLSGEARRVLHAPASREIAVTLDKPWEGPLSAYPTVVITPDGVIRLYYRGLPTVDGAQVTCVAESRDGVTFTKPNLGAFDVNGTRDNNVVWIGNESHNFCPFLDTNPDATPEQRYKALGGAPLSAFASPDGLTWTRLGDAPVITDGAFDSLNTVHYNARLGAYVCYYRDFQDGVRTIRRTTSTDFVTWTPGEWLTYGDAPAEHLYTNAIVNYPRDPNILLGFPMRYIEERTKFPAHGQPGVCDGVIMSSRDGVAWERWREAFVRPGLDPNNWTERNIQMAYGMAQTAADEISLYWLENYRHGACRIRRGVVRLDGFASVYAPMAGGTLVTTPMPVTGAKLLVNYSTSAAGSLGIQICDEAGNPIEGFQSETLFGDEAAHEMVWAGGNLADLVGQTVTLRVSLADADLYSVMFAD